MNVILAAKPIVVKERSSSHSLNSLESTNPGVLFTRKRLPQIMMSDTKKLYERILPQQRHVEIRSQGIFVTARI